MTPARISAAPTSEPTTIPAMAPPESPGLDWPAPALEDAEGEDVLVGNTGGIEMVVGSSTPEQRDSIFALTQHESVELTVLLAQNEHSPCRLS